MSGIFGRSLGDTPRTTVIGIGVLIAIVTLVVINLAGVDLPERGPLYRLGEKLDEKVLPGKAFADPGTKDWEQLGYVDKLFRGAVLLLTGLLFLDRGKHRRSRRSEAMRSDLSSKT
jgi:hypothetical protein